MSTQILLEVTSVLEQDYMGVQTTGKGTRVKQNNKPYLHFLK
jgi:hypothetical protein